jgi:hypothetical protein
MLSHPDPSISEVLGLCLLAATCAKPRNHVNFAHVSEMIGTGLLLSREVALFGQDAPAPSAGDQEVHTSFLHCMDSGIPAKIARSKRVSASRVRTCLGNTDGVAGRLTLVMILENLPSHVIISWPPHCRGYSRLIRLRDYSLRLCVL